LKLRLLVFCHPTTKNKLVFQMIVDSEPTHISKHTLKDGAEFQLRLHQTVEHPIMQDQGFQLDIANAYMCGIKAGYLKAGYMN